MFSELFLFNSSRPNLGDLRESLVQDRSEFWEWIEPFFTCYSFREAPLRARVGVRDIGLISCLLGKCVSTGRFQRSAPQHG